MINLLEIAQLSTIPEPEIIRKYGRCDYNYTEEDIPDGRVYKSAFQISEQTTVTVNTAECFPTGFPQDFSIMTTVKVYEHAIRQTLFTIYSDDGNEQISLIIGRDIGFFYEDIDENPPENKLILFNTSIADGE